MLYSVIALHIAFFIYAFHWYSDDNMLNNQKKYSHDIVLVNDLFVLFFKDSFKVKVKIGKLIIYNLDKLNKSVLNLHNLNLFKLKSLFSIK